MTWQAITWTAELWTYRVGHFLVLNVLDDPAWLALIFC